MSSIKYIMLKKHIPVIFGPELAHSEVAFAMKQSGHGETTSAGFVAIDPSKNNAEAYGESVSLGMEPKDKDSHFLSRTLFGDAYDQD